MTDLGPIVPSIERVVTYDQATRKIDLLDATVDVEVIVDEGPLISSQEIAVKIYLTRFNKIATQGAPQMAVDKEANSLSRVYSYYSKFNLRLFYV